MIGASGRRRAAPLPEPPDREPVNGWLHVGGAVLAAVGLVVLAHTAAARGTVRHVVAACAFGVTAIAMFAASALYHLARRSPRGPLYKRLDHAMIYLFIAGSYTPVCLVALHGTVTGPALLVAVWTLALAGIVQKLRWPVAPRWASTALYLGLGWLGLVSLPALLRTGHGAVVAWLVAGGVLYTLGAVCYVRRWPRGWPGRYGFHELWHTFVLLASASHWWMVLAHVLPDT